MPELIINPKINVSESLINAVHKIMQRSQLKNGRETRLGTDLNKEFDIFHGMYLTAENGKYLLEVCLTMGIDMEHMDNLPNRSFFEAKRDFEDMPWPGETVYAQFMHYTAYFEPDEAETVAYLYSEILRKVFYTEGDIEYRIATIYDFVPDV